MSILLQFKSYCFHAQLRPPQFSIWSRIIYFHTEPLKPLARFTIRIVGPLKMFIDGYACCGDNSCDGCVLWLFTKVFNIYRTKIYNPRDRLQPLYRTFGKTACYNKFAKRDPCLKSGWFLSNKNMFDLNWEGFNYKTLT